MEIIFDNLSDNVLSFSDLALNIEKKKITIVTGKNGSGKSRLLLLIRDELVKEGFNKIGYLAQNPENFFFCNTIYQEILFVLKKNKIHTDYDKKIFGALKMVGLDRSYLDRSPFDISRGEQKKVALAKVLVCNPRILILDEPFTYLDYSSKCKMIKLFRMMKLRYGKTIILATNNTDLALELADDIMALKDGEVAFKGGKFEFFTNHKLLEKFNLDEPKLAEFTNLVKNTKGINLGYRDDINDLIKDIYRFVR